LHRSFMAEAGQSLRVHHKLTPLGATAVANPGDPGSGVAATAVPFGETTAPTQMVQKLRLANQRPVVAAIVGGAGFAAITVGWLFYMMRNDLRLELWERGLESQALLGGVAYEQSSLQTYNIRGGVSLGAVAGGSILLSLAQYFWLPDPESESVPAWAWVAGAAGLTIGLTGLAFGLFERHCEITDANPYCQRPSADPIFAPLLALHAISFISLPIMYLARPRELEQVPQVAFSVTSVAWYADAGLRIQGTF
ncbi:MAG: hypothetical protein RL701_1068, partial [Pseudomonadota bacterium]